MSDLRYIQTNGGACSGCDDDGEGDGRDRHSVEHGSPEIEEVEGMVGPHRFLDHFARIAEQEMAVVGNGLSMTPGYGGFDSILGR